MFLLARIQLLFLFLLWSSLGFCEIEKSWKIRTTGKLRVSFPYSGKIIIRGWSQDQVYARLLSVEEGTSLDDKDWSMTFTSRSQWMELLVRSTTLESIQKHEAALLELRVPMNCELEVWALESNVFIQNISQPISLRGEKGVWEFKNISSPLLKGFCDACDLKVQDSEGSVRYSTKDGNISFDNYRGKKLFLSSLSGSLSLKNTQGVHTLISKTGSIQGEKNKGSIDFQTFNGFVLFTQMDGEVSGRTKTGKVQIHAVSWPAQGEVGVETEEGDVQLSLPQQFNGWVEANSKEGRVFQSRVSPERSLFENRFIEKKGAFIKLKSLKGSITVERR